MKGSYCNCVPTPPLVVLSVEALIWALSSFTEKYTLLRKTKTKRKQRFYLTVPVICFVSVDLEPIAVSDWSFDENCLFCCLRRDKVKVRFFFYFFLYIVMVCLSEFHFVLEEKQKEVDGWIKVRSVLKVAILLYCQETLAIPPGSTSSSVVQYIVYVSC